ncbi:carbon monoxide dehydrogenase [Achromobacter sp. DMS1]|uniref:SRPBCC family protein n=1 Tax=Achromobacter sp. DMS1 TaxID=1688405 RepID=UPI00069DA736|nr:carbon monoxide dehydrogenase subunit G [Achromobacter sp. DMS1]KOF53909.1 carbon monoxide dehydrogenase [Achromobacter sp. DMS1]KOF53913.1 carbon monoxide dehydrogenase [Achromobacter sp. DMS1]
MRIADAQWIPSTQHQTWDALTDPAVLQRCIPGCVAVEKRSPTEYAVTLRAKVAGLDTDYDGEILLSDVDPPNSCTLVFEGKGKAACLAIGTAQVNLSAKDEGTRVAYTVAGMTGGKLAEYGEGVVLKAGEKIIEKFFAAFIDYMAAQPRLAPPPKPPEPPERGLANSRWSWVVVVLVVAIFWGYHAFYK